jgi:hypothetical protein
MPMKMGERGILIVAIVFGIVLPLGFIIAAVLALILEMPLMTYLPVLR